MGRTEDVEGRSWKQATKRAIHERHQSDSASATVYALVALTLVQARMVRELVRIRKLMEQHNPPPGALARLGLTATLIPKTHGGGMDIGTFNPTETDDVLFELHPVDLAGNPLPIPNGLAWASTNPAAGSFAMTGTGARFVTAAGSIETSVSVATPDGSVSDSATIKRESVAPGVIASLGLTATVVPK